MKQPPPHRKITGRTQSGKTAAATLDALDYCLSEAGWFVGIYPHPYWAERLAAELYQRLGEEEFLRRVRVEYVGDTDKVIMRRYIGFADEAVTDPWERERINDEHLGVVVDVFERMRGIESLPERPLLYRGTRTGVRCQQDVARQRGVFFSEANIGLMFGRRSKERDDRLLHCTDPEVIAELKRFGGMSPHDELMLLDPVRRLFDTAYRTTSVMARCSKPPRFDRTAHMNNCGITIRIYARCPTETVSMDAGTDYADAVFRCKSGRVTTPGVYLKDEANSYRLMGAFESTALSTVQAFGISSWHIVQSNNYPTEEIGDNSDQNTDLHIFQQGSGKEARHNSELLLANLDRMREHHRETVTRQVHEGVEEVRRAGSTVTRDHKFHITGHADQVGTQLVACYGERTEARIHYEPGNEQILWQAQGLQCLGPRECWVRPLNGKPYHRQVGSFPDSWAFEGDPEAGIPPLWRDMLDEAMAKLKQLPDYEVPVWRPIPIPEPDPPKPPRKSAPRKPTSTERHRGNGTRRS